MKIDFNLMNHSSFIAVVVLVFLKLRKRRLQKFKNKSEIKATPKLCKNLDCSLITTNLDLNTKRKGTWSFINTVVPLGHSHFSTCQLSKCLLFVVFCSPVNQHFPHLNLEFESVFHTLIVVSSFVTFVTSTSRRIKKDVSSEAWRRPNFSQDVNLFCTLYLIRSSFFSTSTRLSFFILNWVFGILDNLFEKVTI